MEGKQKKKRKTRKSLHDEQKHKIKWNKDKDDLKAICFKEEEKIEEDALERERGW